MNRQINRNPALGAWLRWLGNWGLALADLGYLPAEHRDLAAAEAEWRR
jgi:hypothetical protein